MPVIRDTVRGPRSHAAPGARILEPLVVIAWGALLSVSCGGTQSAMPHDRAEPIPAEHVTSQCEVTVELGESSHSFVAYGSDLDAARHRATVLGDAVSETLRFGEEVAPRISLLLANGGDELATPAASPAPIAYEVGRCQTVELASAEQPVSARWRASLPDADAAAEGDAVAWSAAEALEIARRRACFSAAARYATGVLSAAASAPPELRVQAVASGMKEAGEWLLFCMGEGEVTFGAAPSNTVAPPDTWELVRCEATVDGLPEVNGPTVGVGLGWSVSRALEDARVALIVDVYRAVDVAFGEAVGQAEPAAQSYTFASSLERALRTEELAPLLEERGVRCERWETEGQQTTFTLPPECSFASAGTRTSPLSVDDAFAPCVAVREAGRAATNEALEAAESAVRPRMRVVGEAETAACERACRQSLTLAHGRHEPIAHPEPGDADCSTEDRARAAFHAGQRDRDMALALACLDESIVNELLRELTPLTKERLFDWLGRLDDMSLEARPDRHGGFRLDVVR